MKKYYFLNTLAYECVISVEDEVVKCLHESNQVPFPHDTENGHTSPTAARQFLRRIEDDSGWEFLEGVTSIEEVLEPKTASEDMVEIVASMGEKEKDFLVYETELEEVWEKQRREEQDRIMDLEGKIHDCLSCFVPMPDYGSVGVVYLSSNSFYLLVTADGKLEKYEESERAALENRVSELKRSSLFGSEVALQNKEYCFENIARFDSTEELSSLKSDIENAKQFQNELKQLLGGEEFVEVGAIDSVQSM